MIVTSRRDRNSGDAKVAGTSRSPLLRLPMRSEFFRPSKNQELLAPAAPDCAWFKSIEQDLRRRARLEAECLAEFNQPAALSTYQRGKSVRTTRATADLRGLSGAPSLNIPRQLKETRFVDSGRNCGHCLSIRDDLTFDVLVKTNIRRGCHTAVSTALSS